MDQTKLVRGTCSHVPYHLVDLDICQTQCGQIPTHLKGLLKKSSP